MAPPQRFYPTSRRFHPSGGSTAQLFNPGAHPARTECAGRGSAHRECGPAGARGGDAGPGPRSGPLQGMRFPLTERLSCPVSAAASAASAAPSPAGRPASAGRAATAGVARVVTVGGRTAPVARPPAVGAAAAVAAPAGARSARPPPGPGPGRARGAPARHESPDHQGCDHEQDDACDHGSTLLPFPGPRPEVPRSNPPSDASLRVDCLSPACGSRREPHRRAREMPPAATPQSRVEEVQSFGAG